MKSPFIAILLGAATSLPLCAGLFSDNFDMLVVAERPAPPPGPARLTCAVVDGGYVEAGDPIAGDEPPAPLVVSKAMGAALAGTGLTPVRSRPDVLITYHWGALRIDHMELRAPYSIKSNLKARIELVSTTKVGQEVENHLFLRRHSGEENVDAATPPLLVGSLRTARENADQSHLFVIISAYDAASVAHHAPRVLWRTKLSTREQSGAMKDVIPALITAGAPYLARDLPEVKTLEATPGAAVLGDAVTAAPDALGIDRAALDALLLDERRTYSGTSGGPS
jgi:hypothetical protein